MNNANLGYMNPKVDFAFKYVFGNPDYPEITISLINSVLSLPPDKQIAKVEIANPTLDRRTVDDKYSIMDIRAIANDNTHINIDTRHDVGRASGGTDAYAVANANSE